MLTTQTLSVNNLEMFVYLGDHQHTCFIIGRHITTFRNETSEYYKFCDALLSCDEIFVQTCLDQNFTQKGKGLLTL
jgi:hypothetical protein